MVGSRSQNSNAFSLITDRFLGPNCADGDGLPFAEVLSAERIERVFAKHHGLFGSGGIYGTAIILWSFLGQVLRDGKEASCQSAVARIVCYCLQIGCHPPTAGTGDYCRARSKLSVPPIRELCYGVAQDLELAAKQRDVKQRDVKQGDVNQGPVKQLTAKQAASHHHRGGEDCGHPQDAGSGEDWFWSHRHAYLIDGFTFTMPDSPTNRAAFPHQTTQTPGVGFPIARAVAIVSLATGCLMRAAYGPCVEKGTGEAGLVRLLLDLFAPGTVAVADKYYCSYMLIALLSQRGAAVCFRKRQRRHTDFRKGRRLGKHDHLVTWERPIRPDWMDEATYETIPETLTLRELQYRVVVPGRRTKVITIITTLLDPDVDDASSIAELYGLRWHAELDIDCIKTSLNLNHLRCQSPHMIGCEFWTTLLAYNLIRMTAASAAARHDHKPRQLSFTTTCQYVLAGWLTPPSQVRADHRASYRLEMLLQIASCPVGNRPGRLEPREVKSRSKPYNRLKKARNLRRQEPAKQCT